jgi:predicted small lipoprotein YifL
MKKALTLAIALFVLAACGGRDPLDEERTAPPVDCKTQRDACT